MERSSKALADRVDLDAQILAEGEAAIAEAVAAYAERNRFMHDALVDTGDAWDRVNMDRSRANRPPDRQVDLPDFEDAHRRLLHAGWRLRALKAVVQTANNPSSEVRFRSPWRDMLTGRFRVDEDGNASWSYPDDEPDD